MADASKGSILLVDDDTFLLTMYATKFQHAGYTVEQCASSSEALEKLRGGLVPHVVLFDLTMPKLDGFSFLKALSDEHLAEHALKIALTNQSDDAEKKKAIAMGATGYLVKASMIPSEVVNTVEQALGKQQG
jgi:two-component system chemotaxis response regulator CheY